MQGSAGQGKAGQGRAGKETHGEGARERESGWGEATRPDQGRVKAGVNGEQLLVTRQRGRARWERTTHPGEGGVRGVWEATGLS